MFLLRNYFFPLLGCCIVALLNSVRSQDLVEVVTAGGHSNNFKPGIRPGTLLKLATFNEEENNRLLMNDKLSTFVPRFYGARVMEDGQRYLELQDLRTGFNGPQIMDVKMGCRTFHEEDLLNQRTKAEMSLHFYRKLMSIAPDSLRGEEREMMAVSKARYMQCRDQMSTTATLAFRIVAIVLQDGTKIRQELKYMRDHFEIAQLIWSFMEQKPSIRKQYLNRLRNIRRVITKSHFFVNQELIGTSLLFMHDDVKANVWLIDQARTYRLPDGINICHSSEWRMGNHEDAYLLGLDNLIHIMSCPELNAVNI